MAKSTAKLQNQTIYKVFTALAFAVGLMLAAISGLAWWTHSFAGNMVRSELGAQKIYFPEAGSPGFSAEEYPDIQQYAGQLVDDGEKARAYANGYIKRHLAKVADGKTYSEVSTASMKDPSNETLQKQKQTLFQGETLRGMLLGNGYAFGTISRVAQIAAVVALAASAVAFIMAWLFARQVFKLN
ncbi:hypothetical protein E6P97_01935 [Patescibacteria group bacterium]|nr:MAG: hypothetical protein E6P97_01935 [Patescibacteria group bacterium]